MQDSAAEIESVAAPPGPAAPSAAPLTPMMRQYLEVKAQHPGAILFFRLGDFYEMFFDDAVRAAEILQITLTARAKGDERVPMCGVPYHSAKGYIARLVESGLKVAICDQVEEPGKGLVKREVTRVVTPGMVLDDDLLEARANNFLCAVCFGEEGGGLALLDASTGEFFAAERDSDELLIEEVVRAGAREILVAQGAAGERAARFSCSCGPAALTAVPDEAFEAARAEALLCAHFGTHGLDGFGMAGLKRAVGAAGAALRYLKDTQRSAAGHVGALSLLKSGAALVLDEATRANLEVLRTQRDGKRKGSLLGLLDRSATAMGARRLARWLTYPLLDLGEIERRLDAVGELCASGVRREELALALQGIADLERLTARLSMGQGNARDLRALASSLLRLPEVAKVLARLSAPLLTSLAPAIQAPAALGERLDRAVAEEPPATLKEGGLLREGFSPELDRLVAIAARGKDFLLKLEADERERTKIASLKVRYNRVFGYYIEVTKPNLHLVPKDYVRKQTTAGAERFVTEGLKQFEEEVLTAEEKRFALELELFEKLRSEVAAAAGELRAAADAVAAADALLAFGRVAAEHGYSRPMVDDSDVLDIGDGRHPVVEQMLSAGQAFVPNDVRLDRRDQQILVITGPNMAGKSTAMRQVAQIVLLAQAGSFVPARRAHIGLCDRIFTRVGASDNLSRGQSTFMVEMTETANILANATERSLVVLDEIGRGTSTFDGLSIAWAVAEHLHDHVGARTLFATHYHELVDLSREKRRVKNATVAVKEIDGRVVFLRRLVAGGASRSYGIEVARLAGLPPAVLARARQILANLERAELDDAGRPAFSRGRRKDSPAQMVLFGSAEPPRPSGEAAEESAAYSALAEEIRALDLDRTTPLAALNKLAELKERLREVPGRGLGRSPAPSGGELISREEPGSFPPTNPKARE
jgi:DNA mismatch repair protein MutS